MLFRITIGISYILFVVNPEALFHVTRFNPMQKAILLAATLIYIATRQTDKRILILMTLCLTMVFTLAALTSYPGFSWSILFGSLNQFIVPYLLLAGHPTEKDRSFFLRLSVWLAPASSLLGFAYGAIGVHNPFPLEYATGESRFAGTLNPAFLGGLAAIGMFAAFKLMERGHRRYAFAMLINFVVLVLSAGRMNMIVMVFILLPSFFLSGAITRRMKLNVSMAGLVGSLVVVPLVWLRYADRVAKSGSSGRDFMWDWLLQLSARYPDYGIGFGHQFWSTPPELVVQVSSAAAHNDYIRLLVELGWFGVFAFYGMLIVAVLILWSNKSGRRDISIIFALAGFLLLSSTDNALATMCYFTLIVTAVMASQTQSSTLGRAASPARRSSQRAGIRVPSQRAAGPPGPLDWSATQPLAPRAPD